MKTLDLRKLEQLTTDHTLEELRDGALSGKEILIHQNGKTVFHKVFGFKSADGTPLEPNMLFRAASMTKPITTAGILMLIERGLIDLDEPIKTFYPKAAELKVAEVEGDKVKALRPIINDVTMRHLLSHSSGIGSSPLKEISHAPNNNLPFKDAVESILGNPISFEPGTSQSYSPTDAFDVAAGIAEIVTGEPFDKFLYDNLFLPLGMKNTTFAPTGELLTRAVAMHAKSENGTIFDDNMAENCVFENYLYERRPAGAGLITSAEDYIRFADTLCLGGISPSGTRIMEERTARMMSEPQEPEWAPGCSERWGLGVRVLVSSNYPFGLTAGCYGWSGAYGSHFWIDPDNKLTVVMMKNSRIDGGAGNHSAQTLEKDVSASLI